MRENSSDLFFTENTFPSKLRRCRESQGFSQRELAAKIGISHGFYAQMELGKAILKDREKLKALAEALDISYQRLLEDTEMLLKDLSQLTTHYPRMLYLLQSAINKMDTIELIRSVDLIEKRILYFNEDHSKLADNVKLFLLRKLSLNDKPENGLRPLVHYLMPLSRKIEEWQEDVTV